MNNLKSIRSFFFIIILLLPLSVSCQSRGQNRVPDNSLSQTKNQTQDSKATIVFWNVENYFDPFDDPKINDDEFTPEGENHWTWKRFMAKRNGISKTIISVKEEYGDYPMLVGLCEVENKMVVNQLVNETPLSKLGYKVIHRNSPDARGIDVAMIYREDMFEPLFIQSMEVKLEKSYKHTRDILYVRGKVLASGDTLHVYVLHWPSKGGGEKQTLPGRMAAAKALNMMTKEVAQKNNDAKIIVMGDFNDTPGSKPLLAVSNGLIDKAEKLGKEGKGTIRYQGRWEMIDHFMVSPSLADSKMDIYRPDFLLEEDAKNLGDKPFRTYQGPKYLGGTSDHLPIILSVPSAF